MSKFITVCAVIALALAALAIFEPRLYNDLLNALVHIINSINKAPQ